MLDPSTIAALSSSADRAIAAVLAHGAPSMTAAPRREVSYVAAIVRGAVDVIAKAWKPLLAANGIALTMRGVFCHGQPVVEFDPAPAACELADLLLVVDAIRTERRVRKAILVQAKVTKPGGKIVLSDRSSRRQLSLYQHWPAFRFRQTNLYGSQRYDLATSLNDKSGAFGIIDPQKRPSPGWTQHPAEPTPSRTAGHPSLGEYLAGMIAGTRPGFGRRAAITPTDDWSEVIQLLLDITYAQCFRDAATYGASAAPRGATAFFMSPATQVQVRQGVNLPIVRAREVVPERPSGVSVVHIEAVRQGG